MRFIEPRRAVGEGSRHSRMFNPRSSITERIPSYPPNMVHLVRIAGSIPIKSAFIDPAAVVMCDALFADAAGMEGVPMQMKAGKSMTFSQMIREPTHMINSNMADESTDMADAHMAQPPDVTRSYMTAEATDVATEAADVTAAAKAAPARHR